MKLDEIYGSVAPLNSIAFVLARLVYPAGTSKWNLEGRLTAMIAGKVMWYKPECLFREPHSPIGGQGGTLRSKIQGAVAFWPLLTSEEILKLKWGWEVEGPPKFVSPPHRAM